MVKEHRGETVFMGVRKSLPEGVVLELSPNKQETW
jgi:hypothetical protein